MRKMNTLYIRAREKWKNYKLRHLCIGKVKWGNKNDPYDFKIVNIDWDVHWQTYLYLTVIIRDYLRFFINNTLIIGSCVVKDDSVLDVDDDAWDKWKHLVNSVADEFDELIRLNKEIDKAEQEDISELLEKERVLLKKAFSDLAFIYQDLLW